MGCFEWWLVGLGSLVAPCGWCCGTTPRLTHELARPADVRIFRRNTAPAGGWGLGP